MAIPSELAYLAHTDPPEARRRLLAALEAHGGNLSHTAASLRQHYRTVLRLCKRLGLQETAASLRCSGMTRMSHQETAGKELDDAAEDCSV